MPMHSTAGISAPTIAGDLSGDMKPDSIKKAAEQFEGVFLRDMLKEMRKATDALDDKDDPFNSKEQKTMRDYYDDILSSTLAKQHAVGIADMLVKQLSPKGKA